MAGAALRVYDPEHVVAGGRDECVGWRCDCELIALLCEDEADVALIGVVSVCDGAAPHERDAPDLVAGDHIDGELPRVVDEGRRVLDSRARLTDVARAEEFDALL